jgi:LacI family transcriptional regulator
MKNGKKVPTIFDVSELSGYSISTISRVINNPEKVNDETRRKINDAIDQLGFVPKAEARARALRFTEGWSNHTLLYRAVLSFQRLRVSPVV